MYNFIIIASFPKTVAARIYLKIVVFKLRYLYFLGYTRAPSYSYTAKALGQKYLSKLSLGMERLVFLSRNCLFTIFLLYKNRRPL